MRLKVTRIRHEATRVKSFELRDPTGNRLPRFSAGAHVSVEVDLKNGGTERRQYSLLSNPSERYRYEIAVLLEEHGRGGSAFMHDQVLVGSLLEVSSPQNDFSLAGAAAHSVLIAGGIGITPISAMIHELNTSQASFEVHYAARSRARMAYRSEVQRLAGERATFYLAEGEEIDRLRIGSVIRKAGGNSHVYACGPRSMIEEVRQVAQQSVLPDSQLHFESFANRPGIGDRGISVKLAYSDVELDVSPGETILDAALAAGAWAPYECRRGECGMCATRVLHGRPEHRDVCLTVAERETTMCICVSRAQGEALSLAL